MTHCVLYDRLYFSRFICLLELKYLLCSHGARLWRRHRGLAVFCFPSSPPGPSSPPTPSPDAQSPLLASFPTQCDPSPHFRAVDISRFSAPFPAPTPHLTAHSIKPGLYSALHSPCLQQDLARSGHSINTCLRNQPTHSQTGDRALPSSFL